MYNDQRTIEYLHERIALDVSAVYTLQLTTSSRNRKCKMKDGQNADTRNETRRHLTITQHRHDMIRTTVGRRLLYTTEANKHLIANVHCRITNMQLPSAHSTDYMTKAGCMPTLVCSFSRVCPCPWSFPWTSSAELPSRSFRHLCLFFLCVVSA